MIVLDTNIVLDAFVFNDPTTVALKQALDAGELQWVATQAMRDELARVLAYPKIAARLVRTQLTASAVLARFDAQARLVDVAVKAPFTCRDADDQKFIDLAVVHQAKLLSKDDAVLCMRKRLLTLGVPVQRAI
jgi:putative PIN family toxin of toxin-antitoxin system